MSMAMLPLPLASSHGGTASTGMVCSGVPRFEDAQEWSTAMPVREHFPSTHWSFVLAAGGSDSVAAKGALEALYRTYWSPLYAFARRSGSLPEDARDLTQGFFARLVEKDWVADADPNRGRFRTFLLTAFKRYIADERDRSRADKRGGRYRFVALDSENEESRCFVDPADPRTPEVVYEERWAAALLDSVLTRLREEFILQGREQLFEGLKGFLIGEPAVGGMARQAAELGMTEGAARMTLTRMRQRYRQILRSEIAQTVAQAQDVEDELRHLYAILTQTRR
jgi:RNA polymerase sigma-70 factor (ECF subfamily)